MDDHAVRRHALKERYGFVAWGAAVRAPLNAHQHLLAGQTKLDGYAFLRRYAIPDEPGAYIDYFQQDHDPQVRIALSVRWCPSVEAAHERLVDYLLHCMHPEVPRLADSDIHLGDLGFGGNREGSAGLIFCRGNFVIRVNSIGEKPAPVTSFARNFDAQMIARIAALT